jgi:uncharacterized protein with PQ loop repeat
MTIVSLPATLPDPAGYQYFMLVLALSTSLYSVPQIYHIYSNSSAKDVSVWTWIIAFISNVFWTVYGFAIQDLVVMLSSLLGCVLALILSCQCVYYACRDRSAAQIVKTVPTQSIDRPTFKYLPIRSLRFTG